MPRAIWNGSITFGLVTIPVTLVPAVSESEGVTFHLLHARDKGRIRNAHVCSIDHEEVPWNQIVRGYEHAKGEYVVVTDDELKSFRPEATQTVEIVAFVDLGEVDPMLFDKPYYLGAGKSGRHAYALLREALRKSGKVGIARVVLKTREYLAAVRPSGAALILELMHFASEIVPPAKIDLPPSGEKTREGEMRAALSLIDAMTRPFDAREFRDTHRDELRRMLEARARGEAPPKGKAKAPPRPTNVVDLVSVLQRSLAAKKEKAVAKRATTPRRRAHR